MPEADSHALPGSTNDSWRTWLMTGARRTPVDRRRMRGENKGLKKMLAEGMGNGDDRPHAWKDFSGAMIRHAVDDAMRMLPAKDKQVVKLAYFGGYSNREIALETGLTEATVQRRLRRALAYISEHVQRGRALGRKAAYALGLWLSGRWLADSLAHVAPAATVAAVTLIVVAQPVVGPAPAGGPAPAARTTWSTPQPVVPPVPSPAPPVQKAAPAAPAAAPAAPPLPAVPAVHTPPVVKLPVAVPAPPVKLPLRS